MQVGIEDVRERVKADKKQGQKILIVSIIIFAAFCVMIVCFDYQEWVERASVHWITPWHAAHNIWLSIKMHVLFILQGNSRAWSSVHMALLGSDDTSFPTKRLQQVALTGITGAVLALSGTVYQVAMRNPMAVPTMLGVTSSVNLSKLLVLVYVGTYALYDMTWQMYALSYGLSAIVLAIIVLTGKIAGGKRVSVVDMLLAGTVINRIINIFTTYLRDRLDDEALEVFQEVSERTYDVVPQFQNLMIMLVVSAVVMTPIILMRFSFNAISFEDEEARCMGISPNAMRLYAMVAGGILSVAAMIHFGNVGTLALIVPHVCRYIFGTEFRRVTVTSAFYGAFLLMAAWFVTNFTWIGSYQIPVGSILSIIVMPILIWFSFRQKRGWN